VKHWEWVFVSAAGVYHLIRRHRNTAVIREFMGPVRAWVWGCDCFPAQLNAPTELFQLCLAHQLRDVQQVRDLFPRLRWATELQSLFRRAIHLAIDRQEMLQTLTFGVGGINQFTTSVVKDWTIPEIDLMKLPGYRQPKEQDITEAKRLLTEAGYPNGFKANLFYYSAFTDHPSLAEMVAGQLKRIGVEVSLKGMERATGAEANRQGAYEMTLFSNGMSEAPDSGLRSTWSSKGSVGRSSGLADPELDRLIDEQSVEMDRTKRVEILRKINQLAMDRVYLAPLVSGGYFTVWQPYLHNYYLNFSGTPRLDRPADAWLDVERMPQDRR